MSKLAPLFIVMLSISACGNSDKLSPEDQVKQVLATIEENVEARSMSGVLDHVNEAYFDHHSQTKQDLARILQLHFIRNQQINIFTLVRSIEISDGLASVELSAAMAGKGVDLNVEANRLRADTHRFSVVLGQSGDEWQIRSLSWQRGW